MTNVLPKASPRDPLDDRFIWKNDYLNISGDCSFHLAYTYMRSGKIQYALEEIRKAIKCYNSIVLLDTSLRDIHLLSAQDLGKFNSKVDLEKTQKLRHAWGLVAVITCGMGDNPEAQEECHRAMRNIKYFTSGQG
jgi:tetratricopeptide (TPR) repeat protein